MLEKNKMWFLSFSELLPVKALAVAATLFKAGFGALRAEQGGGLEQPPCLSCWQHGVCFGLLLWLDSPKLLAGNNTLIT